MRKVSSRHGESPMSLLSRSKIGGLVLLVFQLQAGLKEVRCSLMQTTTPVDSKQTTTPVDSTTLVDCNGYYRPVGGHPPNQLPSSRHNYFPSTTLKPKTKQISARAHAASNQPEQTSACTAEQDLPEAGSGRTVMPPDLLSHYGNHLIADGAAAGSGVGVAAASAEEGAPDGAPTSPAAETSFRIDTSDEEVDGDDSSNASRDQHLKPSGIGDEYEEAFEICNDRAQKEQKRKAFLNGAKRILTKTGPFLTLACLWHQGVVQQKAHQALAFLDRQAAIPGSTAWHELQSREMRRKQKEQEFFAAYEQNYTATIDKLSATVLRAADEAALRSVEHITTLDHAYDTTGSDGIDLNKALTVPDHIRDAVTADQEVVAKLASLRGLRKDNIRQLRDQRTSALIREAKHTAVTFVTMLQWLPRTANGDLPADQHDKIMSMLDRFTDGGLAQELRETWFTANATGYSWRQREKDLGDAWAKTLSDYNQLWWPIGGEASPLEAEASVAGVSAPVSSDNSDAAWTLTRKARDSSATPPGRSNTQLRQQCSSFIDRWQKRIRQAADGAKHVRFTNMKSPNPSLQDSQKRRLRPVVSPGAIIATVVATAFAACL
ncbi:unnamed protein product [Amoebophrya sp. A120]|nr:unnamed protein product [Amoebophrya sp. A120]|eukprot:GSA120T00004202001.1